MIGFLLHNFSLSYALLGAAVVYTICVWLYRLKDDHDIKALGARAPTMRSWLPFGFDFLYNAVKAALANRNMEYWQWMFEHTGGAAKGSYTSEMRMAQNVRIIFTADPENIKAILTTQFADYGKGEAVHRDFGEFLGDGIFAVDGRLWQDARALIRPMFVRERVGDLVLFETHVQKLISLLGPGDGSQVPLDKLFFRFSLDAATDFLLGQSADSLGNESEFSEAFNEVQRIQSILARAGPLGALVPRKNFRKGLRDVEKFMEPFIDQALSLTPTELEQKVSKTDTFIHALARFTRDRKVIRDQLMSMLLAGRDTTAATLSWAFLELARNPRVVSKLRAEIKDQLGPGDQMPTYHDIKDMKYLTYILNETLRLYPVVPFNPRQSLVDTTLPRGGGPDGLDPVGVKANTPIGYSPLIMQRRRDLYPPISDTFPYDPLEWVPERWETWIPKPWLFIPFNGGPRICIGQQFAMVEMGYTICRIMQKFEKIIDYGNEVVLKSEIVLTPGAGVNVGFKEQGQAQPMPQEKFAA